jgi:hypothetical protein
MTPVSINGQPVNLHEPRWPEHFLAKKYLEWEWTPDEHTSHLNVNRFIPDDHRRFRPVDRIAVLKMQCAVPLGGQWSGGSVHVLHEPEQEVDLAFYDDDFQKLSGADTNGVEYGHVVFLVRHTPRLLDLGRTVLDMKGDWSFWSQQDEAAKTSRLSMTLFPKDCYKAYRAWALAGFYVPVVNASSESLELAVSWSYCGQATNGITASSRARWNPGQRFLAVVALRQMPLGATSVLDTQHVGGLAASMLCSGPLVADDLSFPIGQPMVLDFVSAIHTGTFYYRTTPRSRYRERCSLPGSAVNSVYVELKSLELLVK